MPKYRYIAINGYTNANTSTLYFKGEIFTATSFDPADFDYGENAESALIECQNYIKKKEQSEAWIPGCVTCWINEFEPELESE